MKKVCLMIGAALTVLGGVAKAEQFDCDMAINTANNISYRAEFYGDTSKVGRIGQGISEVIDESFALNQIPMNIRVLFTLEGKFKDRLYIQVNREDKSESFFSAEGIVAKSEDHLILLFSGAQVGGAGVASVVCKRR